MNIAILFGGSSYEHEISIVSAITLKKVLKKSTLSFIFCDSNREFYLIESKNMKSNHFSSGDYKKAKIPMLPVIAGTKTTKINILVYSFAMLPIIIAPYFFNFAGLFYLTIALITTLYYNYLCFELFKSKSIFTLLF